MYVSSSEQSFGSCHIFVNAASLACLLHPTLVSVNANCRKNKTWLHIVEMNLMRLDLPLTLCTPPRRPILTSQAARIETSLKSAKAEFCQISQAWKYRPLPHRAFLTHLMFAFDNILLCVCVFYFFLLVYCVCAGSSFHCCTFINAFF